jgi:hypothetical protein
MINSKAKQRFARCLWPYRRLHCFRPPALTASDPLKTVGPVATSKSNARESSKSPTLAFFGLAVDLFDAALDFFPMGLRARFLAVGPDKPAQE